MLIRSIVEIVTDEHETGLAQSTVDFYLACADCFSAFLGHSATVDDFDTPLVNRYISWMAENRASSTAKSQRGGLLVLWRYAAKRGLCDPPGNVRRPKLQRPPVWAWTRDEVARLRDYSLTLDRKINGIRRSVYFASLFAAGYETGFRLGDQLSLERSWILPAGGEGQITIVESKTGKQCRRLISVETMGLIDQCVADAPERRLIWPVAVRREQLYRQIRQIVTGSGVRRGSFRHLRRSAATNVEIRQRGAGQRFLNHSDATTTDNHYLDPWQVDPAPLRPVALPPLRDTA